MVWTNSLIPFQQYQDENRDSSTIKMVKKTPRPPKKLHKVAPKVITATPSQTASIICIFIIPKILETIRPNGTTTKLNEMKYPKIETITQTYYESSISQELLGRFFALIIFGTCFFIGSCSENDAMDEGFNTPAAQVFYKGMDLSFMPEMDDLGVRFKDQDDQMITNNYLYLKEQGVNLCRIRLWINNEDRRYNLNSFKAQALKAQAAGMDILLDFHFSNVWADPGAQQTPAVWESLDDTGLARATATYTSTVLRELQIAGIVPTIVQIGNETNNGFLWPVGKIYESGVENWESYALITAAVSDAIRTTAPTAKIMIHHAGGNDANYFYEQLVSRNVKFDVIGLSYYPWWHGTNLLNFETSVRQLTTNFDQDIMIVETAYPFSLDRNDNLNNVVWNNNQLIDAYPATQLGQKQFLDRLQLFLKGLPDERGLGFCYWEPTWVAFPNADQAFIPGSNWENVTLFDFNNKATQGLTSYNN